MSGGKPEKNKRINVPDEAWDEYIIDADFHLNLFDPKEYLEYIEDPRLRKKIEVGGIPKGVTGGWVFPYAHHIADSLNTQGTALVAADIDGLKKQYAIDAVIVGPGMINLPTARYPIIKNAIVRAYNDYIVDKVIDVKNGIYGLAIIPQWDPAACVEEVERMKGEKGIVGVQGWYSPQTLFGAMEYEEMYTELVKEELPLVLHGSGFTSRFDLLGDSMKSVVEALTLSWTYNAMANVMNLIFTGTFDRHDDLKVVIQEAGTNWVPFASMRADECYYALPEDVMLSHRMFEDGNEYLKHMPSEYFFKNMYYTTQPIALPKNPEHVKAMFEMCRASETFLYSSDWPHNTFDPPNWLFNNRGIDKETRSKICHGNSKEVFGI